MASGGHKRPTHCSVCGKPATRRRVISFRGKCAPCGEAAAADAIRQMAAKSGPVYDAWLASREAALRKALAAMVSHEGR